MNELENLVFRNGKWYDRRTNNRVFVKQPTINDDSVEDTNVPLEVDNATESIVEPSEGIAKPPVKRTGGRPKKQTT
jgi:hypothetical protein